MATLTDVFWKREAKVLFALLVPLILKSALKGVQNAGDDLDERAGVSVDFALVNDGVAKWAKDYTFNLVRGITDTTRAYLQDKMSAWAESGAPLPDLTKVLRESGTFNATRAELVASTETTRAYAEGNMTAWRDSGVVSKRRWNTAVDELVCPACGALHMQEVGMDEPFTDDNGNAIDNPPAHPRCRCWVQPVVEA